MIEELVARVFATRNAVHLEHWKTKSYAQHMALGDFYDSIIEKIDTIVEVYQGNFGLIKSPEIPCCVQGPMLGHLKSEAAWIAQHESDIAQKVASLENLIQDLTGEYLRTIYKLENLS